MAKDKKYGGLNSMGIEYCAFYSLPPENVEVFYSGKNRIPKDINGKPGPISKQYMIIYNPEEKAKTLEKLARTALESSKLLRKNHDN